MTPFTSAMSRKLAANKRIYCYIPLLQGNCEKSEMSPETKNTYFPTACWLAGTFLCRPIITASGKNQASKKL